MRGPAFAAAVALAALAALAAWWLAGALRAPDRPDGERGPAWYFADANMTATGRNGEVLYRIASPRITHDPIDDSAVLDRPRLEWLHTEAPPLTIDAELGRIHPDRRRVSLTRVVIVDESTGTRLRFEAPDLEVDAEARLARTDAEVEIHSAHGRMTGRGLVADMNAGTIRLESAVRGRYAR